MSIENKVHKVVLQAIHQTSENNNARISIELAEYISKAIVAMLVADKLNNDTVDAHNEMELLKAHQQLYGFHSAKAGDSIVELVSSMGLTKHEWDRLKTEFDIPWLSKQNISLIDDYLK